MRPEGAALGGRHRHRAAGRDRGARGRPARVHARRPRRRLRVHRGPPPPGRDRPAREPDRPGARRGVGARLGRVRARGRPRPRRQRRHRLLDREPRPDGRPYRRLGHGRAADDALRRGVPGDARRGRGRDPRRRRRHGRLEHPVRTQSRDRRDPRHRDEPPRLPLVGARLEGDRLPDREGRGEARGRLHARRDPERPHRDDAGELRADARLRRRQVPALRVREVPRRRPDARHADEVGRRDDGHRPHLRRGVPEGDALARARYGRRDAVADARRRARRRAPVLRGGDRPHPGGAARRRRRGRRLVRRRRLAAPEAARPLRRRHRGCRRRARDGRPRAPPRCGIRPVYRRVDSCAGEVEAASNYYYSTWGEGDEARRAATVRASSSSAPARTGSARGSSSTTAASTRSRPTASSATRR